MVKLSYEKIIKNDGLLRMYAVSFVVSLGIAIYLTFFGPEDTIYFGYIMFGATLLEIILLVIRWLHFNHFQKDFVVVDAVVERARYYRGTKRVRFEYTFEGVVYLSKNIINYNKLSRMIEPGTEFLVVILEKKPNKALIKDIYFEENQ